jgi:hypothetical protein
MARNDTTRDMGATMTELFLSSGLSVHDFIATQAAKGAFDISPLHEVLGDNMFASFHVVSGGVVYTYYYWQSDNYWYCKE